MLIVGIMGPLGSGKSTLAKHLVVKHDFVRVPMASVLKDMLKAAGLTDEQVDGSQKMEPCALLGGQTPRWAMQTLGTEWGRKIISQDIWVACVAKKILTLSKEHGYERFVIDDVRFPNEAEMVKLYEGDLWCVRRPDVEPPQWKQRLIRTGLYRIHESEKWWMKTDVDWEWENVGPLALLKRNLSEADIRVGELLRARGMFIAPTRPEGS